MAPSSPLSFSVLLEAWRHAEQAAVFAERRWIDAVQKTVVDRQEESERRSELAAAREAAKSAFDQAMNAAMLSKLSVWSEFSFGQRPSRSDDSSAND